MKMAGRDKGGSGAFADAAVPSRGENELTLPGSCVSCRHKTVPDKTDRPQQEKFRPCVACLLVSAEGKLLICERKDFADSWQFPQGGRDFGETPREALAREVWEELSLLPQTYDILEERGGYRYRFPVRHRRRGKYVGQQQIYFRCRFHGEDSQINLETKQPEFRSFRWIEPRQFDLRWLPDFKRAVYARVLLDFFGVDKPEGSEAIPADEV